MKLKNMVIQDQAVRVKRSKTCGFDGFDPEVKISRSRTCGMVA